MPRPIAILVFLIIETLLFPVTFIGLSLLGVVFLLNRRGKNIPLTTYVPLIARSILDAQGNREDPASRKFLYTLLGGSPGLIELTFKPTLWAMRLTGLQIQIYNYPVYSSSNLFGILGHRTTFFDDALHRYLDRVEQVVILGAGWDTRAYGISQRMGVRVFEVDTIEAQAQKRALLEKAELDTTGVSFTTADFSRQSWLDALNLVDFDPGKPTFILWEGVTYFLEGHAVEATLQTVATQLAKGSAIAFDYSAKHILEGDASLLRRLPLPEARFFDKTWMFGISTDPPAEEKLAVFLEQNGLTLAEYQPVGKGDHQQRVDGGLVIAVNDP